MSQATLVNNEQQGLVQCRHAVDQIKSAILRSQARAAQGVNQEQLALYYGIGRYVSENSRQGFWGKGAIENISRMLKEELPGLKGFSAENIKLMRRFYETWQKLELNSVDTTTEMKNTNPHAKSIDASTELQVVVNQEVAIVPLIEKQIVMNIKNFIMTFGKSFTYRGHQVHYEKVGQDHWIDLLFYNRILRCMVVIELKKGKFKPAYLGQLAAYLRVLDDEEKLPDENPSVGLILCKKANKAYVEYVLQDYLKPMGVATYQTSLEQLKALLPPEEELKKLLPEDEE